MKLQSLLVLILVLFTTGCQTDPCKALRDDAKPKLMKGIDLANIVLNESISYETRLNSYKKLISLGKEFRTFSDHAFEYVVSTYSTKLESPYLVKKNNLSKTLFLAPPSVSEAGGCVTTVAEKAGTYSSCTTYGGCWGRHALYDVYCTHHVTPAQVSMYNRAQQIPDLFFDASIKARVLSDFLDVKIPLDLENGSNPMFYTRDVLQDMEAAVSPLNTAIQNVCNQR